MIIIRFKTYLALRTQTHWFPFSSMDLFLFSSCHKKPFASLLSDTVNKAHSMINMITIQETIVFICYVNIFITQRTNDTKAFYQIFVKFIIEL